MPLNFTKTSISIQGLDTKTDEKQVVPGKLTTLENARFVSPGKIQKRNGMTSLPMTVAGSGSISSGVALAANDNELMMFDGTDVWSWLSNSQKWTQRGSLRSLSTTTRSIIANSHSQKSPDVAIAGGLAMYVYEDFEGETVGTTGGSRVTVVDTLTNQVLINDQLLALRAINPRCVAFSGSLYALYGNRAVSAGPHAETLYARRVDPSDPTSLGPPLTLVSDLQVMSGSAGDDPPDEYQGGCRFEALALSDRLAVLYGTFVSGRNSVPKIALFVSSSLTPLASSLLVNSFNGQRSPFAMWSDASENIWLAGCSGSITGPTQLLELGVSPIRALVLSKNLSTVMTASTVAQTPLAPGGLGGTHRLTMRMAGVCVTGSVSTLYYETVTPFAWDTSQIPSFWLSSSIDRTIEATSFGPARALTTGSVFRRSVGLDSAPFAWHGTHYFWALYDSDVQPTYFLLDANGTVVSKANASLGGGARSNMTVSHVATPQSGVFITANQRAGRLESLSGTLFALPGVAGTTVDFVATTGSFWTAKLGNQLHSAGGIVSSYDGFSFVEHGFHTFPETPTLHEGAMGGTVLGSGILDGMYQYKAVFTWTDAYGQIHRSRPSAPYDVTVVSASVFQDRTVTLTVPTLRLTSKQSRSPVTIKLYRTEALGETFYEVTENASPLFNDTTVDTVSFTDSVRDTRLVSREVLYTNGNVLENDTPPTCTMIETWKNRLWLGGLEDPNTLRYSKLSSFGEPVSFTDFFEIRLDAQGGKITAIKGLGDKLVVFKERGIHVVYPLTDSGTEYGGGPDNTGAGGEFANKMIAADVGCVSQNSVELTDQGIFFKSAKGIYLLDLALNVRYVGAPVEAYNGLTITSANLVADANQVRFTTSDGVALVYDYFADQWSVYTNHESIDAVVVANKYYVLSDSGLVREETSGVFSDDGDHIPRVITTGWLSFAGIQGYQRVSRLYILGDFKAGHQLKVELAFDYRDFSQTEVIDVPASASDSDQPPYQFRIDPCVQLCQAIRVRITDLQSGSAGESCSISSLAFEVGTMQGGPRLSSRLQT